MNPPESHRHGPWKTGFRLYASHLLSLFSIALSNLLLGVTLLATPWLRRAQGALPPMPRGARPLLAAVAAYVAWLLLAVAFSFEPATSLRALSEIFSLTTLVLGLLLVRGEKQARWVVDGLILLATLMALLGLSQYLVGYGDLDRRIRGPLSHYMTFSGVLLVADLLLMARLATPGGRRAAWRWLALVVINVAILGSYTRSAWVGLVVASLVLLAMRGRRLLLLLPVAGLIFFLLAPQPLLHRIGSIADLQDESNYDRLCMVSAGLRMLAERPLFGQGPEMVEQRYPIYRHPTAPRYWVPHLHNSFLQLAAERGLPALAAYLALMGIAGGAALRRYRREGGAAGSRADLLLGAFLALLAFNVAGLFEDNWGDTEVQRVVLFVLLIPFVIGRQTAGTIAGSATGGAPAASRPPA